MSEELEIKLKTSLEADVSSSASKIAGQIPEIEKAVKSKGGRVKVQVEADTTNVSADVQTSIKKKIGNKLEIPVKFDINLGDSEKVASEARKIVSELTKNKGNLIDFKIDTNGLKEAKRITLLYKNELEETVKTVLKFKAANKSEEPRWIIDSTQYAQNIGKLADATAKEVKRTAKEVSQLNTLVKSADNLKSKLAAGTSLDFSKFDSAINAKNYEQAKVELQGVVQEYRNLKDAANQASKAEQDAYKIREYANEAENLKKKYSTITSVDYSSFEKAINTNNVKVAREELKLLKQEYASLNAELSKQLPNTALEQLPSRIQDANTNVQILANSIQNLMVKGGEVPKGLVDDVNKIKDSLQAFKDVELTDKSVSDFAALEKNLKQLKNTYDVVYSNFRTKQIEVGGEKLQTNMENARQKLIKMSKEWSAFVNKSPELKAKWEALFNESYVNKTGSEVTAFNAKIRTLGLEIQNAGLAHKTFFQQVGENIKKFSSWFFIGGGVASGVRAVKNMFEAVKDVNTEMVTLRKVTDLTNTAYDKFLTNATKKATALATSLTNYINSVSSFSRMGYDLSLSENLAEVANIYYKVADNMSSIEDANNTIISTLKATGKSADEAITIVDKINELSNKYAVDSSDLGVGLQNSISSLTLAGNDIDQVLAMLTAMSEITQDASESGNALKILSMRIRGMKGELEELGEEYENVQAISKIQTQLLNLTGVNIMDELDPTKFKSTYEIMLEISKVYDKLADVDQAQVLEVLAGKQRGNAISALITSMAQAENALTDSLNSQGSAIAEYEKWLESIEAKQQQFAAQFQALSVQIIDSDLVSGVIDAGTGILGFLTKVVETLGTIPTLAGAAAAALSFKNKGKPVNMPTIVLLHFCAVVQINPQTAGNG